MLGYHQAKDIVSLGDFNVINLNNNKQAKRSWKQYQTEPVTSLGKSEAYGLVCGFSDVEVIDVDLKIFCNDVKSPTHEELVSIDVKWKQISCLYCFCALLTLISAGTRDAEQQEQQEKHKDMPI